MYKKVILFFIGIIFFFGFNLTYANLIFTEVMYYPSDSDTTGEWVELYNNGGNNILIKSDKDSYGTSAWRFKKGLTTEYYINSPDFTIGAGEYVVLADNSSLFVNVLYKVIDSSVSLSNTNATDLAILDEAKASVATLQYTPSADSQDTGKSLQLINGSLVAAAPTPGKANGNAVSSPSADGIIGGISGGGSGSSVVLETISKAPEPKIRTKVTAQTLVFAGIPVEFQASTTGYSNEPLFSGKYFWNFGDGDSREIKMSDNQKFTHTYFYPGEYNVNLEYYLNYYSNIPDATDKIIIKVVTTDIFISRIGDEKDFFIELSNNTNYDADISNWALSSGLKNFTFPKNTIISPKKKTIISPNLTHFSILDKDTLKLLTPQGKIVFDYGASIIPKIPAKTAAKNTTPALAPITKLNLTPEMPLALPAENSEIMLGDNLGAQASAASNDLVKNSSFRAYILTMILTVLIGASAGAVYFIRQKKGILKAKDDFKILDE